MARDIETIRFLKYFSWLDSSSLISTVYNLLPGFTEAEEKKKKEEEEKMHLANKKDCIVVRAWGDFY